MFFHTPSYLQVKSSNFKISRLKENNNNNSDNNNNNNNNNNNDDDDDDDDDVVADIKPKYTVL